MARKKELKIIADFIKPYGYRIEIRTSHNRIVNQQGKFLVSFSGSPSEPHWYKNVIRDLVRYGHCEDPHKPVQQPR